MAERDELFKKFGPRLIEAVALTLFDITNDLTKHPHPDPITNAQLLEKIQNHLSTLELYDWM